jgi:hypothetical protein
MTLMKKKITPVAWLLAAILTLTAVACGAEKDVAERKNLMMPKKSEMEKNSRYKEVEKRKSYKSKQKRKKSKSLF